MHREARGDEDARVHAGDEHRQVEARRSATASRVDDADEEVGREERAEEHDLRRDEEEHPEHARVDARALVRDRRPVVVRRRRRARSSAVASSARRLDDDVSTGTPASARAAARRGRGGASRSCSARERRDDDLVDALVVEGLHRGRVADRGARSGRAPRCPRRAGCRRARAQPALGLLLLGAARVALRRDDQEARRPAARSLADPLEQRLAERGSRSRSRARSPRRRPPPQVDDDVLDRESRRPPCGCSRRRSAAASPSAPSGESRR